MPGLDGTGLLLERLAQRAAEQFEAVDVVEYPSGPFDAEALFEALDERRRPGTRQVVLAESFAGPFVLAWASKAMEEDVAAIVLSGSFVESPLPRFMAWLPRMAGPSSLSVALREHMVRRYLLSGADSTDLSARSVLQVIRSVPPEILVSRIRALESIGDTVQASGGFQGPVLYLHGTRDRLVKKRSVRRVMQFLPQTVLRELDAPHLLLEVEPEQALSVISEFLRKVEG